MLSVRWKILICSILAYQGVLTWATLDLVNTAAYLATTNCLSNCDSAFPYITMNQGGYETFCKLLIAGAIFVLVNLITYYCTRSLAASKDT